MGDGNVSRSIRSENKLIELPSTGPRRRAELVATGADDSLQGIGSDPFRSSSWVGLRVPPLATSALTNNRYLFNLTSFSIPEGTTARIVGVRAQWTLGIQQDIAGSPRVIEQLVTSPMFKLQDGNVSFHIRVSALNENVQLVNQQGQAVNLGPPPDLLNLPNFRFRNSMESALLFETSTFSATSNFYTQNLSAYTPPNGGQPYGRPIASGFGTFSDLRSQYANGNDWGNVDLPVEGPACVQFFASVRQTNIATRPAVNLLLANLWPGGLSPEEQFLKNFPNAIIWRVLGSLVVEYEDMDDRGRYR
jgi:hypothetical protein